MAVIAAACCESRNYGMAQPRKHTLALTAVIQRVFSEGLGEGIARRRGYGCVSEVRSKSFCVALDSLFPFRRSVLLLVNARRDRCADDGIWAERVEDVVADFRFLRRSYVGQIRE